MINVPAQPGPDRTGSRRQTIGSPVRFGRRRRGQISPDPRRRPRSFPGTRRGGRAARLAHVPAPGAPQSRPYSVKPSALGSSSGTDPFASCQEVLVLCSAPCCTGRQTQRGASLTAVTLIPGGSPTGLLSKGFALLVARECHAKDGARLLRFRNWGLSRPERSKRGERRQVREENQAVSCGLGARSPMRWARRRRASPARPQRTSPTRYA